MAKIRYLQQVGSIKPNTEKDVADNCAHVLVLLKKAEYVTGKVKGAINEVEPSRKTEKKPKKSEKQ